MILSDNFTCGEDILPTNVRIALSRADSRGRTASLRRTCKNVLANCPQNVIEMEDDLCPNILLDDASPLKDCPAESNTAPKLGFLKKYRLKIGGLSF